MRNHPPVEGEEEKSLQYSYILYELAYYDEMMKKYEKSEAMLSDSQETEATSFTSVLCTNTLPTPQRFYLCHLFISRGHDWLAGAIITDRQTIMSWLVGAIIDSRTLLVPGTVGPLSR